MKIKLILFILLILLLGGAGIGYWRYYFVFGNGVKSGELNYVVNKGYIFKTYEGKMIQSGFKGTNDAKGAAATGIQSNEFIFSIENEEVAKKLMNMGTRTVDLYYKEYLHTLPWRGNSVYVVDSFIVKVENISLNKTETRMNVGEDERISAAIYPDDSNCKGLHWSSSNNAVATVNSEGEIHAVAPGKATIYAKADNKTASCDVIVRDPKRETEDFKAGYDSKERF